jgi:SRSO17 transposase
VIHVWAAPGWRAQHHPPRVAAWLLGKWPQDAVEPVAYGLASFASQPPNVRRWVPLAKARRRIELDDRELQEELGLDPYERRHGVGWHHHVGLVTVAYAFLRSEQARSKKNGWRGGVRRPC